MAISRTVSTTQADVRLVGTLLVPDRTGPVPAALLVPGSGPVDRDSDHGKMPLGVSRLLAEALADAGVASLRFDKRGIGDSGGNYLTAGFHDNTADAAAMLEVVGAQSEVDPDLLMVIGHSEGAFHAAELAGGPHGQRLAGVSLLAGAARPGAEVLAWQAGAIAPTLPAFARLAMRLLHMDLVDRNRKTVAKLRATTNDVERVGFRKQNAKWLREFVDLDPREALARIHAPVLAVTGSKDIQTPPEDVDAIGAAVAAQFEGHVVDDVNHILRLEPGAPSVSHYKKQSTQPLAADVVQIVTDWATARHPTV